MKFTFDGRPVGAEPGQSVAAALWAHGARSWRRTRHGDRPRGVFCGIGVCFDCLVVINGVPGQRACLVAVNDGDVIATQPRTPTVPSFSPSAGTLPVRRYDAAVVGAGPAGLAAAASATAGGARTVIVDAAPRAGGQYWRHRPAGEPEPVRRLRATTEHLPESPVWFVERAEPARFRLHTPGGVVEAGRLVLATGAYDRSLPFPGWDLPGVVTAGGAQSLLKGHGVAVGRRVVVAGAGPFLLVVAAGLARAGVDVGAVVEAGQPAGYARQLPAIRPVKLAEAARYLAVLARHRVPYLTGRAVISAHGTDAVEAVTVARLDGTGRRRIEADALAVSYGFTPQVELPLALACATRLDVDGSLVVAVDDDQGTSVAGVYAAGEVTGVGGADLARIEGTIAGLAITGQAVAPALRRRRARAQRFAAALHAVHRPPDGWPTWLDGETVVCRCEEVRYDRLREAVALGATDTRAVKLLARAGMGWCQGRTCGSAVTCLTALLNNREPTAEDQAAFATRAIASPVPLGRLAGQDGVGG